MKAKHEQSGMLTRSMRYLETTDHGPKSRKVKARYPGMKFGHDRDDKNMELFLVLFTLHESNLAMVAD
ncbi:hypothetical protein OSB04_017512 [Centaurea solstitialis]|uniref:Uncharacterized protein n=1 Tax=Centaurea solstitialis TaxID=347529 RepID=A0AA38TL32_9ASTR|nr:hypothetical protein OSB04_017512 [Centaurea solstitialis]